MQYQNMKSIGFQIRTIMIVGLLMSVLVTACGQAPTPAPEVPVAPPPGPTPDPNIPASVITEPQPGQPSATANYNTVIYGGPGTNYVVYGAFLGGKKALVVGKSTDSLWWAVDIPVAATKVGWVSASWVTVQGVENVPALPTPPVPPTTDLVPPGPNDPQAVSIANTYVRTGPGDNYPAYGIASAGAKAWVIGKNTDGTWLVVRLNPQLVGAGYGWVAIQYVQASNIEGVEVVNESAPPIVEEPPAPAPGAPSGTALDYLNVRTGPGMNYGVLFAAPPGASSTITGRSADNQWWQVQIPTKYSADGLGWVSQAYVSSTNTESVPVVGAPPPPSFPEEPPTSSTCALVAQNPADNTVLAPNSLFQASWTVQNTGQTSWDVNSVDVRYLGSGGVPLHQGSDLYDLVSNVAAGQNYTFTVPMIAPSGAGEYGELWGIFEGSNTVCRFWLIIEVQ